MENNWTIEQTKALFNRAQAAKKEGKGLVWAFTDIANQTGRSVNSVRNYYYSQLKMFELLPRLADDLGIAVPKSERERFTLFTGEEIESLVDTVLTEKAKGQSVRKTIAALSNGDRKQALRLQNKYRSMVLHHRAKVTEIMKRIGERGDNYFNPYTKEVVVAGTEVDNYRLLTEYIGSLDESEVGEFLSIMKKFFA